MQFLQMLLKEGKLSEEQALAYVDAIKKDIEVVEEKEEKEERVKEEVERVKAEEQAKEERCNDFANFTNFTMIKIIKVTTFFLVYFDKIQNYISL